MAEAIRLGGNHALDVLDLRADEQHARYADLLAVGAVGLDAEVAGAKAQDPVPEEIVSVLLQHHVVGVVTPRRRSQDKLLRHLPRLDPPVAHSVEDERGEGPDDEHQRCEPEVSAEVEVNLQTSQPVEYPVP